ncbi:MAG: ABC transporter ATP-binding protein [Ostreibacterium sp.]
MPQNTIVEFQQVGKTYDGKILAVKNINLSINRGEFITLLGPSGSGKSTTLMMLAGFEQPSKGEIIYKNKTLSSIPAYQRNFGMVFQNYALFPHMSVLDNVIFPLKIRNIEKNKSLKIAKEVLDKVHLSHFDKRSPHQLSGGQQQRVALARAIVFNPDIVLMDEPLGALDKKLREEMQIELKKLHEELGMTFIFVTHDQDEALTMSNRIAVFNQGEIEQISKPKDLYENPNSAFVAAFIGDTNMLEGQVLEIKKDSVMVQLDDTSLIEALNISDLKVGDKTQISIRPERITISNSVSDKTQKDNEQQLSAKKIEVIYRGSYAIACFQLKSQAVINVKLETNNRHDSILNNEYIPLVFSTQHARAFLKKS